jgi:hypothetical protein
MNRSWKGRLLSGAVGLCCAAAGWAARGDSAKNGGTSAPAAPVKSLLAEENNQLEREIASRMMRRIDLPHEKRVKLELEIDLRILERAVIGLTADAKFESDEQAAGWLRGKQLREAVRGMEEAVAQDSSAAPESRSDAIAQLHKLSYSATDLKGGKGLDDFCHQAALAMFNAVSASPVNPGAIAPMRPKPLAGGEAQDRQPTTGDLIEQVQKLAAISVPLRQQLAALSSAASGSADKEEGKALHAILGQCIALARGLQSNTAVSPDARAAIETQLAEGIALFSDPRTRGAGRARIDALGQYRQTLARIGKMSLSREQMEQLAPALAWAQANPEAGAKLLADLELFMDLGAKWDALPKDVSIPTTLRRPLDDLRAQFGKSRAGFMQDMSRIATQVATTGDLEQTLDEMKRLYAAAEDLQAMGPSIDTLNSFKIKPVGGLEKKITTAAIAAANPISSSNRTDAQKYLDSVHHLAVLAQRLAARPLTDIPPAVAQGWAGGKMELFESRWRAIVYDLAGTLIGGAIELDKGKSLRLESALAMGEGLRTAAQLEAVLPRTPALARWADWSIDPASLQLVLSPYKEAMAAAFFGYASDNLDAVDNWTRLHTRYLPVITLILRDAPYAEQCEAFPTGFAADISRLATPFEGAPFATERFASCAIGIWATLERSGDFEAADRIAIGLAKRLARDLRLTQNIDESSTRTGRKRG